MFHLQNLVEKFGPWQKFNLFTTSLVLVSIAMQHTAMPFIAPNIGHWCAPPDSLKSVPVSQWKNLSLPKIPDGQECSSCLQYDIDYDNITESEYYEEMEIVELDNSTKQCSSWSFNKSFWHETIITDWNLVCKKTTMVSVSSSIYQLGIMIGVFIFGQLTDKYGRKFVALGTVLVWLASGTCIAFSPNIYTFIVFRFVIAFVNAACQNAAFVLSQESLSGPKRNTLGFLIMMPYSLGIMVLAGTAYWLRNWRYIQLFSMAPVVLCVICVLKVVESPEWLISVGKLDAAVKTMKKIGNMNSVKLPDELKLAAEILEFKQGTETDSTATKVSILNLFKTRNIRRRTLASFILCFTASSCYYSITLNMETLGGDLFINMLASAALEMLGTVLMVIAMNKIGRRIPIIATFLLASVVLTTSIFIPEHFQILKIGVCLIGRTFFWMSSSTLPTYVSEYTPTVLRSVGAGSCIVMGFFGGALAPYVRELGVYTNPHVPLILYSSLSLLAGIVGTFLPETFNKELPRTIAEAENFGRKQKQRAVSIHEKYISVISEV